MEIERSTEAGHSMEVGHSMEMEHSMEKKRSVAAKSSTQNFEIPDNPEFTYQIRRFKTTDPAHADLFNGVTQALINNDSFLKMVGDQLRQLINQHIYDMENPHETTPKQLHLEKIDNTSDTDKPVSTAQRAAIDASYQQATGYTNQKIADLIGGAPTTLDTLGEIADAMAKNADVVAALNVAIGKKANEAEFDSHAKNTTAHITASERNYWNGKAEGNHTHNYSVSGHTHDDRYYTESEMNTKLSGKADSGHTHNYAAASHSHDDRYFTESEMNTKLAGKANSGHTHDDRYYTESEMNTKLAGKADSGHTHNYAAASHTHDYLPLTGGTLTGSLSLNWKNTGNNLDFRCENNIAFIRALMSDLYIQCKPGSAGIGFQFVGTTTFAPIYAASFTVNSSRRYKTNIAPISDDRAKELLDVEIVTYDYIEGIVSEKSRYNRAGVEAEQVERVLPEVVTYKEIDGEQVPDGVDYSRFVPYLIRLAQTQQAEIDRMKSKIHDLTEAVEKLKWKEG